MDELDWWTSPIDHHGHPDGPRPDECAVCALQVDRDRLRVEGDALHEWGHQLAASGKALVAELERLGADAVGLRMLLTEATAERDQLRAVVNGTIHALDAVLADEQSDLRPPTSIILRTVVRHLRELDVSWEPTVEIGGQLMTEAQYNAARFPLIDERDRLRAIVEAVQPLLAPFVRFVRLNPGLADDDPLIARVFNAYRVLAQLDGSADIGGEEA
jgi:hypothetical protein